MKVYRSCDDFTASTRGTIVTVGTFDGVHTGHRKIIERLIQSATELGGESLILTFFPHPRMVLYPEDNDLRLLNTIDEKTDLLRKAGVRNLIIHPFTKEFSRMSAVEFIRDLLVNKLHMRKIVIGYNHQFGRNREGTFEQLIEMSVPYHFQVEEIPEQDVNHVAVSSTKIREALLQGDTEKARQLLGYDYGFTGKVVRGNRIGATLGFPTANIAIPESYKLIPGEGIYAANAEVGGKHYRGMLYIGKRPVINGKALSLEMNIFDFNEQIYDEYIRVTLLRKIRDDQPFSDMESLKIQMLKDKEDPMKIFAAV